MYTRIRLSSIVAITLVAALATVALAQRGAVAALPSTGGPATLNKDQIAERGAREVILDQRGRATGSAPSDVAAQIAAAAQAVLATLDEARRAAVQFPFDSSQKTRWSNLPSPMFQRTGLRMADLTRRSATQ